MNKLAISLETDAGTYTFTIDAASRETFDAVVDRAEGRPGSTYAIDRDAWDRILSAVDRGQINLDNHEIAHRVAALAHHQPFGVVVAPDDWFRLIAIVEAKHGSTPRTTAQIVGAIGKMLEGVHPAGEPFARVPVAAWNRIVAAFEKSSGMIGSPSYNEVASYIEAKLP